MLFPKKQRPALLRFGTAADEWFSIQLFVDAAMSSHIEWVDKSNDRCYTDPIVRGGRSAVEIRHNRHYRDLR